MLRDILKSAGILIATSYVGFLFDKLGFTEANIITLYILGVLIISVVTKEKIYSLLSSLVSVVVFNYLFTEPRYTLWAYDNGYPVTFLVMFGASFITGSLAARLKENAKQSAQVAFRTKVLFDANQQLQQAKGKNEIADVTARQLSKLLGRNIIIYLAENEKLGVPFVFSAGEKDEKSNGMAEKERQVAEWVLEHNTHAGATTRTFSEAEGLYLAIRINDVVFGVIGIIIGDSVLDSFEQSILLSILGECALALENEKNAREKAEAAIMAKNEQLRANLLRAISHDLRTPLTSISGNASNLLSNGNSFSEETKKQLYADIYDDSLWLINLVENILFVTRIEEGRMHLNVSTELLEDVIIEALKHTNCIGNKHTIIRSGSEELILVKIDARLIVQVIINIVDNAIKYTPEGTDIHIAAKKDGDMAEIRITDNGNGIADDVKPHIFDMFYSGTGNIADSKRGLGLGLSLCKSIVEAHGGMICVSDNHPQGTVFTFTLPVQEVDIHE